MLAQVSQLFGQDNSILGWILQLSWLLLFVVFMFYGQRIQTWNMLREVEGSLVRFKLMRDEGRKVAISTIKEVGKPQADPTAEVDRFLEYVALPPAEMDPAGIYWKLEHVLDVWDARVKDEVRHMAPEASEAEVNNLENLLGAALALNVYYKFVRHFYTLGKKTMSLYVIMQVQMALPLLMREAKAHLSALRASTEGQPIGDGAGALVAAKLMREYEKTRIAKDVVMAKVPLEGRTAFVLKAEGPGGNAGKPGDAIKRIIEENGGNIASAIIVDAGQKWEGEKVGEVIEGVGVAIGGIGIDRFKVDETVLKHRVPVHAVVIKEDLGDAISTMRKEIVDAADVAIDRIKRLIREGTREGDSVIIAGIGNTMGIGQ